MAPPAASQHEPPQQAPANDHERAELMERNAQVERELQQIKDRLLLTESQLDEERHARNEREERVRKAISPCSLSPAPLQGIKMWICVQEHDRELKQFEKKQRELERIREEDERRHEVLHPPNIKQPPLPHTSLCGLSRSGADASRGGVVPAAAARDGGEVRGEGRTAGGYSSQAE